MNRVFLVYSISEVHFLFFAFCFFVFVFSFKYASWFELCFCFFVFLKSLYVYFVLTMQVYIVNTQKWLILYTFAQKKGKYCTNFVNVYKICQFFCVYNINLHCN